MVGAAGSPPRSGAGAIRAGGWAVRASAGDTARWTGGPTGGAPADGAGDGAAVPLVGGVPVLVPVPAVGRAAGRDSARCTGVSPRAASEVVVPDAGVTGRTGASDPDSGWGTARCTGAPVDVVPGEPVRRSSAGAVRSGGAAARREAGAPLSAGGVVPPSVRRTARCTGGDEAVAPLPAGADAGPSPGRTAGRGAGAADAGALPGALAGAAPDGWVAVRWTGGVPDAVPLPLGAGACGAAVGGAGGGGLLPPDGWAAARWTGVGAVGVAPLSGAVTAGLPLPGGTGTVGRTGASAAVPLSGRAGEPDGRAVARWTGGAVGGVPLPVGVVAAGLPLG